MSLNINKPWKKCPECGCPFFNLTSFITADNFQAWKDTDGTWYCGPAQQTDTRRCASCGKTQVLKYKKGKLEE